MREIEKEKLSKDAERDRKGERMRKENNKNKSMEANSKQEQREEHREWQDREIYIDTPAVLGVNLLVQPEYVAVLQLNL